MSMREPTLNYRLREPTLVDAKSATLLVQFYQVLQGLKEGTNILQVPRHNLVHPEENTECCLFICFLI